MDGVYHAILNQMEVLLMLLVIKDVIQNTIAEMETNLQVLMKLNKKNLLKNQLELSKIIFYF